MVVLLGIELSHISGAFRAALKRSTPLLKRPGFPVARVSGVGSLDGNGRGPVFASSSSCLLCFIDAHFILLDAFAEGRVHVLRRVGNDVDLSLKYFLELQR